MAITKKIISPAFVLSAFAGVFLGAFFWLWASYGPQVIMAYLQGVALSCF